MALATIVEDAESVAMASPLKPLITLPATVECGAPSRKMPPPGPQDCGPGPCSRLRATVTLLAWPRGPKNPPARPKSKTAMPEQLPSPVLPTTWAPTAVTRIPSWKPDVCVPRMVALVPARKIPSFPGGVAGGFATATTSSTVVPVDDTAVAMPKLPPGAAAVVSTRRSMTRSWLAMHTTALNPFQHGFAPLVGQSSTVPPAAAAPEPSSVTPAGITTNWW
jgi:hypothetical protein